MRILIIYKERVIRNALFEILRDEGYNVYDTDDISFGTELAFNVEFDIILTGIDKDKSEWLKIMDQIQGKRKKNPKIVLITRERVDEDDLKKKGAFGVLYSPINLAELLSIIDSA